jgi:hypothetical protein
MIEIQNNTLYFLFFGLETFEHLNFEFRAWDFRSIRVTIKLWLTVISEMTVNFQASTILSP